MVLEERSQVLMSQLWDENQQGPLISTLTVLVGVKECLPIMPLYIQEATVPKW